MQKTSNNYIVTTIPKCRLWCGDLVIHPWLNIPTRIICSQCIDTFLSHWLGERDLSLSVKKEHIIRFYTESIREKHRWRCLCTSQLIVRNTVGNKVILYIEYQSFCAVVWYWATRPLLRRRASHVRQLTTHSPILIILTPSIDSTKSFLWEITLSTRFHTWFLLNSRNRFFAP